LTLRRIVLVLGLAGLAAYAWLAVQVYRAQADPESFRAWDGENAWIVGPTAKALNKAADARIEQSLAALGAAGVPAEDRLRSYRESLRRAEDLLVRSLRAQPAQARALARLAAVRWELDPPLDDEGVRRFLDTIETAARMAPGSARVQKDLGDLLARMGHTDDAVAYLARAVDLDPGTAKDAVEVLLRSVVPPEEIRMRLPKRPEVLVALYGAYFEAGQAEAFLTACEAMLATPTPALLEAYAAVAIPAKQAARALERIDRLGVRSESDIEAERLLQRSRLGGAAGNKAQALDDARAARRLQPDVPRFAEWVGHAALAAGDPDAAVAAYREALALVARRPGNPVLWRAAIYRDIGRAEEARRATDRAYDAYRKAIELNPEEPHARRRLAEMHKAAGLEPTSKP
jgi:tetratricopeptide (TPR) repeat protein